jgi:hypothetical protein
MWRPAAAWLSGLHLALFGYRPLAEHMRAGLRRVTRRAYPRCGMLVRPHFRELEPDRGLVEAARAASTGGMT